MCLTSHETCSTSESSFYVTRSDQGHYQCTFPPLSPCLYATLAVRVATRLVSCYVWTLSI